MVNVKRLKIINLDPTCPLPLVLLVSLTLANEIGSFIQWAPKLGDSGCTYIGFEGGTSALPPGTC